MVRLPAVAGLFYPDNPDNLRAEIAAFLNPVELHHRVRALVAPHAGYVYSGAIAAEAYRGIHIPNRVILLCPNHTGIGPRASIMPRGAYRIPGMDVPIASDLTTPLLRSALLEEDRSAHAKEHALEVHLPFLVHQNPKVEIAPIVLGALSLEESLRLGEHLANVIAAHETDVLLVASTDMSHFISAEHAATLDHLALDAIVDNDPERLFDTVMRHRISMCGVIPTTAVVHAAKHLNAARPKLLRYGHSGEVNGDCTRVVGYASLSMGI